MSTPPARHVRLVSAHSVGSAWDGLLGSWLQEAHARTRAGEAAGWLVTSSQSVSYFIKERALASGLSLAGIRMLVPDELREGLSRAFKTEGSIASREDARLLLTAAAEAVSGGAADAVRGVAKAPDSLLGALDRLERSGWNILEEVAPELRPVLVEFQRLLTECGLRLQGELDRSLLARAAGDRASLGPMLFAGFDGQHWPQWSLLTAAALSASSAVILLPKPRSEAAHLDSLWSGTWEQYFGGAEQIAETESPRPFGELLYVSPGRRKASARAQSTAVEGVNFLVGNDPGHLAEAIATRVLHDLAQPDCHRVGIVFARPGPLSRLVSLRLAEAGVPHNDAIGHPLPGPFERPAWEAWRALQEDRRIGPFVNLLRHCPPIAERCRAATVDGIEKTLRDEVAELLIDDLAVLATSLAERAGRPLANAVGECLRAMVWLPEQASLPDYLSATLAAFLELDWVERHEELKLATAQWLAGTNRTVSRGAWLRWLNDSVVSTTKLREALGKHPYARAHLLTYGQAESQAWTHVIACDLNQSEWPPEISDDGWLAEREMAALNARLPWLNMLATAQGVQGEGHDIVKAGHTWCLTPSDEHAIAERQFANLLENTAIAFTAAASLRSASAPERISQPGELFNRLHFCARGEAISVHRLNALRDETLRWTTSSKLWTRSAPEMEGVESTRTAWNARRARGEPFGEYQFGLRNPPAEAPVLSATAWEAVLKRPALIWMENYLGVDEPELADVDLAPAAIGRWTHRWLASIAASGAFTSIPEPQELERKTRAAASAFRDSVISLFAHCGREVPDWWMATWGEAAGIGAILSRRLGAVSGWTQCAAEWRLKHAAIPLASGRNLQLKGRIDLILTRGDGEGWIPGQEAWIVDYKTGDPEALRLDRMVEYGDGLQLALYGLAVGSLGLSSVFMSRVGPSLDLQAPQLDVSRFGGLDDMLEALASMQESGVFGQRGALRSEYGPSAVYPLATLAIDEELLEGKWEATHREFSGDSSIEDFLP